MHQQGHCIHGLQWHHILVLFRSGVPQNKQLVLSWSRIPQDGWTSGHMASHLAPTSASMLGWHQQTLFFSPMVLTLVWSSGSGTSDPNCPYPLIYQETQIWKNLTNLNEFWRFSKCLNGFRKRFRYTSTACEGRPMIQNNFE